MSWPASLATSAVESCKRALSEHLENTTPDQASAGVQNFAEFVVRSAPVVGHKGGDMSLPLQDRVAIVVGSSSGMGRATAVA